MSGARRDLRDLTLGELGEVVLSLDVGAMSPDQLCAIGDAVRAELARRRAEFPSSWRWRRVGLAALERVLEELEREWIAAAGADVVGDELEEH